MTEPRTWPEIEWTTVPLEDGAIHLRYRRIGNVVEFQFDDRPGLFVYEVDEEPE